MTFDKEPRPNEGTDTFGVPEETVEPEQIQADGEVQKHVDTVKIPIVRPDGDGSRRKREADVKRVINISRGLPPK